MDAISHLIKSHHFELIYAGAKNCISHT